MPSSATLDITSAIKDHAHPLRGEATDLDPVLDAIGDAEVALLGEATHGTHEFYDTRAELTHRLIEERGFEAVAVEADWPDAYRVNRYVRHLGSDATAEEALGDFVRFPRWMWRNTDVINFATRLRRLNADRDAANRVGFYGLDLYSLYRSADAVIAYLADVDPPAAARARKRYACLDHNLDDPQQYGYQATLGLKPHCRDDVINQLIELRGHAEQYLRRDGLAGEDEHFFAEENAKVVRDAEHYYRAMFGRRDNTWNLRDRHMVDTLASLRRHLKSQGRRGKVVVWEHNSHIGDARATSMSDRGEHNVGQLSREAFGEQARLVGFTTYDGTVAAASDWDGEVQHKSVRPALPDSIEAACHDTGLDRFVLRLDDGSPQRNALRDPLLERAIGVIYRPESERVSHYFDAAVAEQFDVLIHFDRTTAVTPLDRHAGWEQTETPETYPFGV
ncbi:MAG: erythromycin esterase family protein [Phycisphaeraceae bacterium]